MTTTINAQQLLNTSNDVLTLNGETSIYINAGNEMLFVDLTEMVIGSYRNVVGFLQGKTINVKLTCVATVAYDSNIGRVVDTYGYTLSVGNRLINVIA